VERLYPSFHETGLTMKLAYITTDNFWLARAVFFYTAPELHGRAHASVRNLVNCVATENLLTHAH
jgi:hypothetical protein